MASLRSLLKSEDWMSLWIGRLAAVYVICLFGLREPNRASRGEEEGGWQRSAGRASLAAATLRGISSRAVSTRQNKP